MHVPKLLIWVGMYISLYIVSPCSFGENNEAPIVSMYKYR